MDSMTWDYILKYVIVGDSAVGKSSLLLRLTDPGYTFGMTEPTLGVEFGSRVMCVGEEGKRVKVQCWDTAGTESFRSITRSYFRGAAGALLVYDVTRRESFEHVTSWLNDLRDHADENVSIILVANKTDLCYASPPPGANNPDRRQSSSAAASEPSPAEAITSPSTSSPPADTASAPEPAGPSSTSWSTSNRPLVPRAITTEEGTRYAQQHGLLYVETSAKEGWNVIEAFEWTAREVLERLTKGELDRRKPKGVRVEDEEGSRGSCC